MIIPITVGWSRSLWLIINHHQSLIIAHCSLMMHCHRPTPWWNLFFSFSQSAPTVSVSRARETISRKKEEKVKLIFISASIGHSFELACLRGLFLQFCTTCSLLRSRRSTLEMCFLGLPGEHICLKIFFVMSVPTWNLGSDRDQQRGRIRKATVGSWRDRCRLLHNIWINSKMHLCILKRTKKTLDSLRLVT